MSREIAIRVRGLKTAYGEHVVHEHLDLDMYRGEVLGVIGPSGTGKSVLLRAITGLKRPEEGSVEVFGREVTHLFGDDVAELQSLWGVMFQDGALFSNLTVRENVMVPMKEHSDLPPALMAELADQKIRTQLKDWEEQGYGNLPICMAKTQYSFTTDPTRRGAPTGHAVPIREVRLSAGAGFVVVICGEIMTMPGLPRKPAAESIRLNEEGEIEGLF